jgi:hypothetical protein
MPLILDTYNILHVTGILPPELAGIDLPGLVGLISRSRYGHEAVELICDGAPPRCDARPHGAFPGRGALIPEPGQDEPGPRYGAPAAPNAPWPSTMRIRYAGYGQTADSLIARMVSMSTAPRRLLVVSSDHEITRTARRRGCRTLRSDEFLQHLADDADLAARRPSRAAPAPRQAIPPMMTEQQVQGWAALFGLENADVDLLVPQAPATATTPGLLRDRRSSNAPAPVPLPPPRELASESIPDDVLGEAERLVAEFEREEERRSP